MEKKRIFAGLLSAFIMCTSVPAVSGIAAESTDNGTEIIYSADFEDGVNDFTGRDSANTLTISDSGANGSSKCMVCSGREKNWHGPQILLDGMCEPGVQYTVSAWVKAAWYNEINISMEYTD